MLITIEERNAVITVAGLLLAQAVAAYRLVAYNAAQPVSVDSGCLRRRASLPFCRAFACDTFIGILGIWSAPLGFLFGAFQISLGAPRNFTGLCGGFCGSCGGFTAVRSNFCQLGGLCWELGRGIFGPRLIGAWHLCSSCYFANGFPCARNSQMGGESHGLPLGLLLGLDLGLLLAFCGFLDQNNVLGPGFFADSIPKPSGNAAPTPALRLRLLHRIIALQILLQTHKTIHQICYHILMANLEDWRRIDVEQYDPELQYEADPVPGARPDLTMEDMANLEGAARSALQRGSPLEGLRALAPFAPYGAAEDVREAYLKIAYEVLTVGRVTEAGAVVAQMDLDEVDLLTKLCYTLMKHTWAQKQAGVLLVWLERVAEKHGEGPIVRFVSDPAQL